MSPDRAQQTQINDGFSDMLNFFGRGVSRAQRTVKCTAFDEFAFVVDETAERNIWLAVDIHWLVRKNSAVFDYSEMQLLVDEMIFAENIRCGILVVKIIEIGHR